MCKRTNNAKQFTYSTSDDSHYQTGYGCIKCRHYVCSRSWELQLKFCSRYAVIASIVNLRPYRNQCERDFCQWITTFIATSGISWIWRLSIQFEFFIDIYQLLSIWYQFSLNKAVSAKHWWRMNIYECNQAICSSTL